jgi:hypothetical protein
MVLEYLKAHFAIGRFARQPAWSLLSTIKNFNYALHDLVFFRNGHYYLANRLSRRGRNCPGVAGEFFYQHWDGLLVDSELQYQALGYAQQLGIGANHDNY